VNRNSGNYLVNSELKNAVTMDRRLKVHKKLFHHSFLKSPHVQKNNHETQADKKKELTLTVKAVEGLGTI
jgi:hypothetical protein